MGVQTNRESVDEIPSFQAAGRMNAVAVIRQRAHRLRLEAQGLDALADFLYSDVREDYPLGLAADEALWKLAINR